MKFWLLMLALAVLFFLTRRKKSSLEAVLVAFQEPLELSEDLGPYENLGKQGKDVSRFQNSRISIFYIRSFLNVGGVRHLVESIDLVLPGYPGGYIITFVDEEVKEWTHSGIRCNPNLLHPEAHRKAHKVLEAAREAWKNLLPLSAA